MHWPHRCLGPTWGHPSLSASTREALFLSRRFSLCVSVSLSVSTFLLRSLLFSPYCLWCHSACLYARYSLSLFVHVSVRPNQTLFHSGKYPTFTPYPPSISLPAARLLQKPLYSSTPPFPSTL